MGVGGKQIRYSTKFFLTRTDLVYMTKKGGAKVVGRKRTRMHLFHVRLYGQNRNVPERIDGDILQGIRKDSASTRINEGSEEGGIIARPAEECYDTELVLSDTDIE